jgi:hypothetical protein
MILLGRVEPFGEPAVDLGQHSSCFVILALALQKAAQARHRAELPRRRIGNERYEIPDAVVLGG